MIKTFRGILADGAQIKIRLSTKKGKIGYRIVRFQVVGALVGSASYESVTQVWKIKQAAAVAAIDFSDGKLLAIGLWSSDASSVRYNPEDTTIIFDREIFNQDIYVTQQCGQSGSVNYYLELETINLSDNATLVSTLSDIRLNPQVGA